MTERKSLPQKRKFYGNTAKVERNRVIYARYLEGDSTNKLARIYKLTQQRVFSIVKSMRKENA